MALINHLKILPPTLVRLSEASSKGVVIFLPDVGGNVIYARELVLALKGDCALYGACLSEDMAEQLPSLTVESICRDFASDIAKTDLARPIHLVGFSFAAFFAAETARQLSMLDAPPDRLWIIDMPAQHRIRPRQAIKFLRQYAGRILSGKKSSDYLHKQNFIALDISGHPESYRRILRTLYSILTTFKPRPWTGNATVVVSEYREVLQNGPDDLGWSKAVDGDLTTYVAPGDHLGMLYDPNNVAVLAELIRVHLKSDVRAPISASD
jgi:thioesterase domain-containing protein